MSDSNPRVNAGSPCDADLPPLKFLLIGVAVIIGFIASVATAVGRDLVFGWFFFLDRSLASFQPDGPTFWAGVGAFAMLFAVVHQMGSRWLSHPLANLSVAHHWTWRSTLAICLGITLLFAASVAMVASLHQLIWLAGNVQSTTQHAGHWGRTPGPLSVVTQAQQSAGRRSPRTISSKLPWPYIIMRRHIRCFLPESFRADGAVERGWVGAAANFQYWVQNPEFYRRRWDDPEIAEVGQAAVPGYFHPELGWHGQFDERGFALMHYAGNVHVFPNNRGLKMSDITDGTSHTLAIGEVAENFQPWASPYNRRDPADGINDVPWGFGGPPWQDGANFALMDGAVRFISRKIDRRVLKALGTPAGKETIPGSLGW